MSFSIQNQPNRNMTLKEKTLDYGQKGLGLGIVAGAIESSIRKTWLNSGKPNDSFEKQVIKNMEKTLPKDEYIEVQKINKFFADLTNPESTMDSLKSQLMDSNQLKDAVTLKDNETKEQAIERIFSKENKIEVKKELMDLQSKTTYDKKVDKKAAKELINANFNKEKKALQKAANTSEEMFKVLKKSAAHVKLKRGLIDTAIGAFIGGVGGLLIGSSSKNKQ